MRTHLSRAISIAAAAGALATLGLSRRRPGGSVGARSGGPAGDGLRRQSLRYRDPDQYQD